MIPITIECDIVTDDGSFDARIDRLVHCCPRVGDDIQFLVDMDVDRVRRVGHYADGTIHVCTDSIDYESRSIAELFAVFVAAGCRCSGLIIKAPNQ